MRSLPFVEEILADLRRFKECVEDNQDVDLDRDCFDLLTKLGLLERVQRSPARWMMTQAGEDAIAQPAAGEPVAWIIESPEGCSPCKSINHLKHMAERYAAAGWSVTPLYAAPPAAANGDEAVRKDAARYQALRNTPEIFIGVAEGDDMVFLKSPDQLDQLADNAVAMRAQGDGESV